MKRLALAMVAGLGAVSGFSVEPAGAGRPLNFVVIMSDELPPEYIGAYGGREYPTPNLDRLAADGMRFNSAFSTASVCTPARYALQTGRYPGRSTAPEFLNASPDADQPYRVLWNTKVYAKEPTLARQLAALGYNTGMAGKWHLGPVPSELPAELRAAKVAKDARVDDPATREALARRQALVRKVVRETAGYTAARSIYEGNAEEEEPLAFHNIPYITRGAVELLREFAADKRPFLLVAAPTAVHGPWLPDSLNHDLRDTIEGRIEDVYDYAPDQEALRKAIAPLTSGQKHRHVGMVEIDHMVGRIRGELERLGVADNTVVIYTADHGVEPGKASVYDRGMRVPLLVFWPGLTRPGTATDALAQHVDITAAIAHAAGVPDVARTMDGVDLRPLLADPTAVVRDYAYFECGYTRGVTDGRYKHVAIRLPDALIAKAEAGRVKWLTVGMGEGPGAHAAFSQLAYPAYYEPDQLYDLAKDPFELRSVWDDPAYAAQRVRLKEALRRFTAGMPHVFPVEPQPFFFTAKYREIAERTRRENNPHEREVWVKRDHDSIPWPPERPGEHVGAPKVLQP